MLRFTIVGCGGHSRLLVFLPEEGVPAGFSTSADFFFSTFGLAFGESTGFCGDFSGLLITPVWLWSFFSLIDAALGPTIFFFAQSILEMDFRNFHPIFIPLSTNSMFQIVFKIVIKLNLSGRKPSLNSLASTPKIVQLISFGHFHTKLF